MNVRVEQSVSRVCSYPRAHITQVNHRRVDKRGSISRCVQCLSITRGTHHPDNSGQSEGVRRKVTSKTGALSRSPQTSAERTGRKKERVRIICSGMSVSSSAWPLHPSNERGCSRGLVQPSDAGTTHAEPKRSDVRPGGEIRASGSNLGWATGLPLFFRARASSRDSCSWTVKLYDGALEASEAKAWREMQCWQVGPHGDSAFYNSGHGVHRGSWTPSSQMPSTWGIFKPIEPTGIIISRQMSDWPPGASTVGIRPRGPVRLKSLG